MVLPPAVIMVDHQLGHTPVHRDGLAIDKAVLPVAQKQRRPGDVLRRADPAGGMLEQVLPGVLWDVALLVVSAGIDPAGGNGVDTDPAPPGLPPWRGSAP